MSTTFVGTTPSLSCPRVVATPGDVPHQVKKATHQLGDVLVRMSQDELTSSNPLFRDAVLCQRRGGGRFI